MLRRPGPGDAQCKLGQPKNQDVLGCKEAKLPQSQSCFWEASNVSWLERRAHMTKVSLFCKAPESYPSPHRPLCKGFW